MVPYGDSCGNLCSALQEVITWQHKHGHSEGPRVPDGFRLRGCQCTQTRSATCREVSGHLHLAQWRWLSAHLCLEL